jgi:hypothetical protein
MHLEADCSRSRLALALPGGSLAKIGEILASYRFGWNMTVRVLAATTIIDQDLQVHFSLAAKLVDIAEELALI